MEFGPSGLADEHPGVRILPGCQIGFHGLSGVIPQHADDLTVTVNELAPAEADDVTQAESREDISRTRA
jgi:hypothetical protein